MPYENYQKEASPLRIKDLLHATGQTIVSKSRSGSRDNTTYISEPYNTRVDNYMKKGVMN